MLKHKELSEKIIAAAYAVHKELGQGFVEKIYKNAMEIELRENGLKCNSEVPLNVSYHGQVIGDYFADIVVENKIIVEVKAVSDLMPVHEKLSESDRAARRPIDKLWTICQSKTSHIWL
jgi:GxxExxY protein